MSWYKLYYVSPWLQHPQPNFPQNDLLGFCFAKLWEEMRSAIRDKSMIVMSTYPNIPNSNALVTRATE